MSYVVSNPPPNREVMIPEPSKLPKPPKPPSRWFQWFIWTLPIFVFLSLWQVDTPLAAGLTWAKPLILYVFSAGISLIMILVTTINPIQYLGLILAIVGTGGMLFLHYTDRIPEISCAMFGTGCNQSCDPSRQNCVGPGPITYDDCVPMKDWSAREEQDGFYRSNQPAKPCIPEERCIITNVSNSTRSVWAKAASDATTTQWARIPPGGALIALAQAQSSHPDGVTDWYFVIIPEQLRGGHPNSFGWVSGESFDTVQQCPNLLRYTYMHNPRFLGANGNQ